MESPTQQKTKRIKFFFTEGEDISDVLNFVVYLEHNRHNEAADVDYCRNLKKMKTLVRTKFNDHRERKGTLLSLTRALAD